MRPPGGRSASVRSGWCHSPTGADYRAVRTDRQRAAATGRRRSWVAAALEDPLRGEYHDATGTAVVLVHKTRRSGLRVGAAMDHLVDCPAPVRAESRFADGGLVTAATVLAPGQKLRVIKFGG